MNMHDGYEMGASELSERGPITIKKYANRRLYNTATSCYVTLDYLAQLVKTGAEFAVYDAKTGEDITRSVLTHIIVEEEAKGQSMLPGQLPAPSDQLLRRQPAGGRSAVSGAGDAVVRAETRSRCATTCAAPSTG